MPGTLYIVATPIGEFSSAEDLAEAKLPGNFLGGGDVELVQFPGPEGGGALGGVEEALRFINHASRILSDPDRRAP